MRSTVVLTKQHHLQGTVSYNPLRFARVIFILIKVFSYCMIFFYHSSLKINAANVYGAEWFSGYGAYFVIEKLQV